MDSTLAYGAGALLFVIEVMQARTLTSIAANGVCGTHRGGREANG